jgi:hypothetical protein
VCVKMLGAWGPGVYLVQATSDRVGECIHIKILTIDQATVDRNQNGQPREAIQPMAGLRSVEISSAHRALVATRAGA